MCGSHLRILTSFGKNLHFSFEIYLCKKLDMTEAIVALCFKYGVCKSLIAEKSGLFKFRQVTML